MACRMYLKVLILFITALRSTEPFQWSPGLEDNAVQHACPGGALRLPWDFNLTSGEEVSTIEWFFRGDSEEVIAMFTHGQFVPMSTFSHRVQYVPGAGIIVTNVTTADWGEFSVEVLGKHVNQSFLKESRSATVQLGESPTTDHGDLEVNQDKMAFFDNTTGQWSVRLTCGHFTNIGKPPVRVVWTTPSGRTVKSSGYSNGNFSLLLSDPLEVGNYTCSLDPQSVVGACLFNGSQLLQGKGHRLDEVQARLTLLEARKKELVEENLLLKQKEANMTNYIDRLEKQVEKLENITEYCAVKPAVCAPGNHTVLDDAWRDVNNIQTDDKTDMCDRDLSEGWYRFLLNGQTASIPTSCVEKNHCGTDAPLWLNLQGAALPEVGQSLNASSCASWDNDCCHSTWGGPVTVVNCGEYFVYYLIPTHNCDLAHCVTTQV